MRWFSIIGSLVVLACVVVVSYSHTYSLMESVGFHGVFGHFAVIAFEALFLVSVTNIVFAKTKGVPPGTPLYLGSFLGLSVVFWGNVRAGMVYGVTGAIIGGLIPITLVVGESILAFSLVVARQRQEDLADANASRADQADSQPAGSQAKPPARRTRRQPGVPRLEEERARKVAIQLREELGRWPGRPKLAEKAGVRESVARRVLDELKAAGRG